ncbi:MAG TPA: Asp-tRNA(Asn)/Glu-tRNA(Gln) amidotransferase subunit GatC [Chloroflexota bacterium]|nr:Asp-tRNA(Asn)/Glu-tRNA(Gln) amidotransferase subunit GatC [Chloroflexota bacterium]
MKISQEEVDHIAMLARLALTDEERERFRDQLGQIIGYVEMMNQLDTAHVPPSTAVLGIENVTRPDVARPGFPVDLALANAPERVEDLFAVPPVLEDE